MFVKFKKIRFKNFLAVGNEWIEINLESHNTTLIVGTNGCGKSTFLDALDFGLYNKPFRKVNLPQLVNSVTKKNCVVEVEFEVGKTQYTVVRGMKPKVFEIYQDGTLINQTADSKDYQSHLEKNILQANYKSFNQVVILGSATYIPFMSMTVPVRREIIDDILDLNVITVMNTLLKDRVSNNNVALRDAETEEQSLKGKIDLTKRHMEELKGNNDEIIAEKEKDFSKTLKEKDTLTKQIVNLDKELIELQGEIEEDNYTDKINQWTNIQRDLLNQKTTIDKELTFFEKHDDCPTCGQDITDEFKTNTTKEMQRRLQDITEGLTKIDNKITPLKKRLKDLLQDNSVVTGKLNKVKSDKSNINGQLSGLNKLSLSLQTEIERLKQKSTNIDDDGRLEELETALKDKTELRDTLKEVKTTLAAGAVFLKDSGIKARIIKQYIPVINDLLSNYLEAMEFFTKFELNENFEEIIRSVNKNDFTYESFSQGQKMRINLAILFTWRDVAKLRNSVNTNLLILDETLDGSLDDDGVGARVISAAAGAVDGHIHWWEQG